MPTGARSGRDKPQGRRRQLLKLKSVVAVILVVAAMLLGCAVTFAQAPVPVLDNIDPRSGIQGTTLNVVLSGSWFTPTAKVNFSGAGVVVQSVRFVSPTALVATVVLSARPGDYAVTISDEISRSNAQSFSIVPGKITDASQLEVAAVSKMTPGSNFYDPSQMWVSAGNAFVTDATNAVVKRVSLADGSVITLAGKEGEFGFADGYGNTARFGQPAGVWADGSNVYVTDSYFDSVRQISLLTGYVSTIAGSPSNPSGSADGFGSGARFRSPNGIWGDGTYLYVCDTLNFTLRKIKISTGEVTTLAGQPQVRGMTDGVGPSATFYAPVDVWGDGVFLYVADGNAVRKVSLASGEVRTFVGVPSLTQYADGSAIQARFNFIGGIWGDGVSLFIADSGNDVVRKVSLETGAVTTLAGLASFDANVNGLGTQARFNNPTDIAGDGNAIYIVDRMNSDIKQGTVPLGGTTPTPPVPGTPPAPAPIPTTTVSQIRFQLPSQGGLSQTLSGESNTVRSGYGRLLASAGSFAPSGFAIFSNRQGGVLVSEATVPVSEAIRGGRIAAQIDGIVNTGIAIANPNSDAANLSFYFTDAAGATIYSGTTTLPAGTTVAAFLNERPFAPADQLQINLANARTFTFFSSVPIGVTALRGFTNERSEFLITTLPVASFDATDSSLIFAHYADGGGWKTQIVLVNPTDGNLTGLAEVFTDSAVGAAGSSRQTIPYGIAPRSAVTLQVSSDSPQTRSGWIRVTPDDGSLAPSGLLIFSFQANGITLTQAGIPGSTPASAFRVYAEASGDFNHHEAGSTQSGFAVTNSGDTGAAVSWELFRIDGTSTGLRGSTTIPPQSHVAVFLNELSSFQNIQTPFKGFLRISDSPYVTSPSVNVVGIRGRYNERGDFLITSTAPTSESVLGSPSAQRLFPYFVDGGGYTTQFVLLNGGSGQTSSGTLNFMSPVGLPLNVQIHD